MTVTLPIHEITDAVRGARVGLLTNGTFWLEEAGDDMTGVVKRACRELVVLYGEHGPRGCEGGGHPDRQAFDPYLGCKVRNVSTISAAPDADAASDLDLLMVAMPDIGCRHYTYKRTMCHVMEDGARLGLPVVVVDFPNPVAGHLVEGSVDDPSYWDRQTTVKSSLYFRAPLAYRHGMTMGELALYAKDYLGLDLDLRVIKLHGWRRDMYWQDTGWPYIPFDPSIYSPTTTISFLCTGLFQGTSVSWGIGTAEPFQVIGAPWIEDDRLLHAMREHALPGLTWTRAHFVPRWIGERGAWRRYAGELCNGVRLHVTDPHALRTARVQLTLLVEMLRLYPGKFYFMVGDDFTPNRACMDRRTGHEQWGRRLSDGEGVDSILPEWQEASKEFERARMPYLLY